MTTDIDLRRIRETEAILQEHMALFGYDLIDVPLIANADIFLTRAGDTIIEELFTFERFGQLLALRPEFTAAVAHRYTQIGHTEPVRWQLSGAIFVDEPSDYSMQYQEHNIGAELIGQNNTMADAEIIAMAVQGMNKLEVSDWQVVIGHVGLQLHLLSRFNLDSRTFRILLTQKDRLKTDGKAAVMDYLSEILTVDSTQIEVMGNGIETQQLLDVLLDSTRYGSTMGGRTRHDISARLLKKHDRGLEGKQISDAIDFLQNWGQVRGTIADVKMTIQNFIADDDVVGQQLFSEWLQTLALLREYAVPEENIILQPDITKNWDYYTGIVFGIRVNESYVASGGRYDGLTQLLGGEDAFPAVGFAYYTQALLAALPEQNSDTEIVTIAGYSPETAIQWATALRNAGIPVQILPEKATITTDGSTATYSGKQFSQTELIEELKQ